MRLVTLLIAAAWLGTSALAALAANPGGEKSDFRPAAAKSLNDDGTARKHAVALEPSKAADRNAGKWACMARSTYGTHGTITVWSDYTLSRQRSERSALDKCNVSAVNKQDCRVSRCWVQSE
jgi:hypothetical protein